MGVVDDRRICAVDLGLNTDAVCSIMTADGTVLARKFINFASEKDHLSASYNIGARYFVRELLKPLPAMVRSQLSANVPDVERRIQVTLATLKVLYPELKKLSTQAA